MRSLTKRPKVMNFVGLLASFGLGQGSLFVAQSWLLATGQVMFMGRFSFIFTMIILAYQAIDLGGLVILARHAAVEELAGYELPTFFWSFSTVRALLAIALAIAGVGWLWLDPNSFDAIYTAAAIPGLLVFSINPSGLLDGNNKSGWSGATWALPFIASTIALPISVHLPLERAGLVLGGALSVGAVVAVIAQYVLLHIYGAGVPLRRPAVGAIREGGYEALFYMIGWLPGQIYFRGQAAISMVLLGPVATALFIYAKQAIMSGTRFLYFARRVEFANLVQKLADGDRLVYKVLTIQRISLVLGAAGMVCFAAMGLVLDLAFPPKLRGAGSVIALFAPIILTSALYASFMQASYAVKRTEVSARSAVLSVMLGLGLQQILVPFIGIVGIAVAEGVSHLFGAIQLAITLNHTSKSARITSVQDRDHP